MNFYVAVGLFGEENVPMNTKSELSLDFLYEMIFTYSPCIMFCYYYFEYEKCGSSLDENLELILLFYLGLIVLRSIIYICGLYFVSKKSSLINKLKVYKKYFDCIKICLFCYMIFSVQTDIDNIEVWTNCGDFKSWTIAWLVYYYIWIGGYSLYVLYTWIKDCFCPNNPSLEREGEDSDIDNSYHKMN